MLFITNRAFHQGIESVPGRKVDFNLRDNTAGQSVYFCTRQAAGEYTEIGSSGFMDEVKKSNYRQVVFYIHGYSNLPEPNVFDSVDLMQKMFDDKKANEVLVIPLIWPCDSDVGMIQDYFDDQVAADASAIAFSRAFGKFLTWREKNLENDDPCLRRISIIAHSMGNRVLRAALATAVRYICPQGIPLVFRNVFLVAADIVNESLEEGKEGAHIPPSARNVVVYFASDDLALRSSKIANLANKIASRRLGHTGPENMDKVPHNVYAVDCDDVNNIYDRPTGHSYFLTNGRKNQNPGKVFNHIWDTIMTGRPPDIEQDSKRKTIIAD
jgi:esterase/lipase superfamily enzyme